MGPELSTAATDQNFAWIWKQHQDLIGSVLIFRTKIIWSGPEFGLVRSGYLNAANNSTPDLTRQSLKRHCTHTINVDVPVERLDDNTDFDVLNTFNLLTFLKSKKISNDQELIQSAPTSCPQKQKGNN